MFFSYGGDAYLQLEQLIPALDEFIGCTGQNMEPCLAEAVDTGELGIHESTLAFLVWSMARGVVVAMPQVEHPYKLDTSERGGPSVGLILSGALVTLHATMKTLLDRWELPMDIWGGGVHIGSGRYRVDGDEDGIWHPITPPIVEPAEHEVLERCRKDFFKVWRHLESQGWGEHFNPPLQLAVESVAVEVKPAPKPAPKLKPEPKPAVEPTAASKRAAKIKAIKRSKAVAEKAKALTTGAKPSVEPDDPSWGEPFHCSLNGLFTGMKCGKYTKKRLKEMVAAGKLKCEKLGADERGPLGTPGNWNYRVWIRDERRRGYMRDYLKSMTESEPVEKNPPNLRPESSARTGQNRP